MLNLAATIRWQPILNLAILLASLGSALPAQANGLGGGGLSPWQSLCEQYLPASACATDLPTFNWGNPQNINRVGQTQGNQLSEVLPLLPAETSESTASCFMRNVDGSLLDLSQLCNATSSHPVLAHISVSRTVKTAPQKDSSEVLSLGEVRLGEISLDALK